ncbi:MAG: PEP-CTERM sorting domain-containing protein [Chitinivibrionales bacterium]|nr:PEP-CTERM sorting domain-containing protein [Chitinivibrionales bacterium]
MRKAIIAVLISIFVAKADFIELIDNGSFEDASSASVGEIHGLKISDLVNGGGNQSWDVYDVIPAWTTSAGEGIELQKNTIVDAQNGNIYVELDSHPGSNGISNSTMFQSVSLTEEASLQLSFWYKPRTALANDNGIKVTFDGVEIAHPNKKAPSAWEEVAVDLGLFGPGSYDLAFAATGEDNTLGGFVDNVSLKAHAVAEPGSLSLMGIGLLFLAGWLRKRRNS